RGNSKQIGCSRHTSIEFRGGPVKAHESILREFLCALTRAREMRQIVDERVFVLVDKRGKFVVVHRVPYCYGRAKGDSVPEDGTEKESGRLARTDGASRSARSRESVRARRPATAAGTAAVLGADVRQDEHPPGQRRLQSLAAVVTVENGRPPFEQIRIVAAKIVPRLPNSSLHPLMNEGHVRPGDRFVIERRLAVMRSEALQRVAESLQRLQHRHLAKVTPDDVHVIAMVEAIVRKSARFEAVDELALGHEGTATHRLPACSINLCASTLLKSRP